MCPRRPASGKRDLLPAPTAGAPRQHCQHRRAPCCTTGAQQVPTKRRDRGKTAVPWWRRRESNPGPKTPRHTRLRTYPTFYIAPSRACRRVLLAASPLFDFAFPPVARESTSQLGYARREALAGLSFVRLSDLLFRQRGQLRYRSQLGVPRVFTWASGPRYAAMCSLSPSKPIAPVMGKSFLR